VDRYSEVVGRQVEVEQLETVSRHELPRDLLRHQYGQIGILHDVGQRQEGRGRQRDLAVQVGRPQHLQRLRVRTHRNPVERLHLAQCQPGLLRHGVVCAQQHDITICQELRMGRGGELGQKTDGQVDVAAVQRRANFLLRPGSGP